MRDRRLLLCVLVSAAVGAVEPLRAAAPTGVEFQVNDQTVGAQRFPWVAVDGDGDFVVVWHSDGQDGSGRGVFARRFASSGMSQGGEFQVNSFTSDDQKYPRVAIDPDGAFVVVWASNLQDGSYTGVFAQRFASSGAALGGEFQVSSFTESYQEYPALAIDGSGGFVVAWFSDRLGTGDIFARRFDASGTPLGAEFQVNVHTQGNQIFPEIGTDGDGDFVVVWQGNMQDGYGQGVFARRFDASGTPAGAEFQVNTHTPGNQMAGRIAVNGDGDFVIAWHSPQDGGANGVFARRFSDAGTPQGAEFQVTTYTLGNQNRPAVGMDGGGGFVVAWQDSAKDGSFHGVFARRFGSTGTPETPEFQVNMHTELYQVFPSVAMEGDGDFVVVWQSLMQDGDADGIFAQRFHHFSDFDVDGDGETEALTDGLLILRYLFGFRGATLVTDAVGAECIRCDAPAIEDFLEAHL